MQKKWPKMDTFSKLFFHTLDHCPDPSPSQNIIHKIRQQAGAELGQVWIFVIV